jgi:hypothetical protein
LDLRCTNEWILNNLGHWESNKISNSISWVTSSHKTQVALISIYHGRLFVCLSHWDLPKHGAPCHMVDIIGKLTMINGALRWSQNA